MEQTASLQRVCVNGHEVLCLILTHFLAELIDNGTVDSASISETEGSADRNWLLKESARTVTNGIVANGLDGSNASIAVKKWRNLRHLAAVLSGLIIKSG